MTRFKKALILSWIFHIAPLVLLVLLSGKGTGNGPNGKPGGNNVTGKNVGEFQKPIEDKPVEVDLVTLPTPKQKGEEKEKDKKKNEKKKAEPKSTKGICGDNASYGGIGVTFSMGGKVMEAPEWYPAYKAGIRAGDALVSANEEILGTPGTVVTITVRHEDGNLETMGVTRGKICYKELGLKHEP